MNLFLLDEVVAEKSFSKVAAMLSIFPAQAFLGVISCAGFLKKDDLIKWAYTIFHPLRQSVSEGNNKKFFKTMGRMANAFYDWHNSQDSKLLLELPIEERKLLMTLTGPITAAQ